MKVLIYEPNELLEKFISNYMYTKGLIPVVISNPALLFPHLTTGEFDVFLSDYSDQQEIVNDIIFNLKLDESLVQIKIFITTPTPEKEILYNLIRLGINGFVKKPFLENQFKELFSTWLQKNQFKNNKRVHVRVEPKPADNAFVYIRTRYRNSDVKFSVVDISVGGVAIKPPSNFEQYVLDFFKVKDVVKEVKIKIRHFMIVLDMQVVDVKQQRVSFRFTSTNEKSHKYIFRYISESMQSE